MTPRDEIAQLGLPRGKPKRSKYGNRRVTVDDITFDSVVEARHYRDLKLRLMAGEIRDLKCHPKYPILVGGMKICTVIPDFEFVENGRLTIHDVKGGRATLTPIARLKYKLIEATYGGLKVEIIER